MTGSNSLIGQQSGVSRMAGLAPFKGLDPETKKINAFAKFQIEPAVNRPQSAKNVLFSNDHEDTYEEPANPSVVWPYNCLLISGKLPLTWQCIGRRQLMFSYHPSTLTNLSRECENDVKLVSVSMLNAISWSGGEQIHRCSEYKSSDPERFVDEWRLSGVVQEVEPIAEGRLLKHPLATIVVQGVAKAINLWAACVPKPHQLSRLWLLLVRRPRNFEKARKVRDAWCKLKQLALLPPRVRSQEQQADFVERVAVCIVLMWKKKRKIHLCAGNHMSNRPMYSLLLICILDMVGKAMHVMLVKSLIVMPVNCVGIMPVCWMTFFIHSQRNSKNMWMLFRQMEQLETSMEFHPLKSMLVSAKTGATGPSFEA
jgi:hypothetical protein